MNSLEYIDGVFKIALDYYQNKEEISVEDSQSILLSVYDKVKKALDNNFLKVCMEILEHNPQIGNRHCCGNYLQSFDIVEIIFSNKLSD